MTGWPDFLSTGPTAESGDESSDEKQENENTENDKEENSEEKDEEDKTEDIDNGRWSNYSTDFDNQSEDKWIIY